MELKEFIKETLTQIVDGVVAAQEATLNTGAIISPADAKTKDERIHTRGNDYIGSVYFEVGLTNIEGENSKHGIGVWLGSIGIGTQSNDETGKAAVTNIKFSVPIMLPQMGTKPKPRGISAKTTPL